MTCHLSLTIIDRELGLPVDIALPFGCGKSAWGEVLKRAGFVWRFHTSEQEITSIDGVRCWFTDSVPDISHLAQYLVDQNLADGDGAKDVLKFVPAWLAGGQYRFIVELE